MLASQSNQTRGQSIDRELLEQLQSALPTWKSKHSQLSLLPIEFSWNYRSVVSMASAKDDVIESFYSGGSIPDHFYVQHTLGVEVSNPEYIASLQRGKSENEYFLTAGRYRREGLTLKLDYRYGEFHNLLTCGYTNYLGLEAFLADEEKIKRLFRTKDNTVVAEWILGKDVRGIESGVSLIELDPANNFQMVRSERTNTLDRGTNTIKTEIVYHNHETLGMIPKKLLVTEKSTKIAGFSQVDSFELVQLRELSSLADTKAKCFLEHYGVPESALAALDIPPKSPSRRYIFIGVSILLGFLFVGASYWYTNRRK